MKLLLPLLLTPLASLHRARLVAAEPAAAPDPLPPRHEDAAPDWRHAYQRLRDETQAATIEPLSPVRVAPTPVPTTPEAAPVQAAPLSPTARRVVETVRQIAEPAPALTPAVRVWQVELPSSGPAWQLRVEQAQPQAPLQLELRVPAVLQLQARQQLVDLDRRLREAGHDVLKPRCRAAARSGDTPRWPIDEVPS